MRNEPVTHNPSLPFRNLRNSKNTSRNHLQGKACLFLQEEAPLAFFHSLMPVVSHGY